MALKMLIDSGVDINVRRQEDGVTPLICAASDFRGNKAGVIDLLLDSGADIHAIDSYGRHALIAASVSGQMDTVNKLITKCDKDKLLDMVNLQAMSGDTALIVASSSGFTEIVDRLLENGAELDIQNVYATSALIKAAKNDRIEVVSKLLDVGADMELLDIRGTNALVHSAIRKNIRILSLLLERGADVNVQDSFGRTALIYAVKAGLVSNIKVLLEHDAYIAIRDENGRTALDYAENNGDYDIVELLKNYKGAFLESRHLDGAINNDHEHGSLAF